MSWERDYKSLSKSNVSENGKFLFSPFFALVDMFLLSSAGGQRLPLGSLPDFVDLIKSALTVLCVPLCYSTAYS